MSDQGDNGNNADLPDPKPGPAKGPVIDIRDLPPRDDRGLAEAEPKPPIESSLVGADDGIPAAEPRRDAEVIEPSESPDDVVEWRRFERRGTGEAASPDEEPSGEAGAPIVERPAEAASPAAERLDEAATPADERADETAPPAYARAEPAPVLPPPAAPPARRGSFMPAFLGGVIAAGLGAGAMYFLLDGLPAAPAGLSPEAETTVRTIAGQLAEQRIDARIPALTDSARTAGTEAAQAAMAAAPAAAPTAPDTAALDQQAARIQSLEARLTALAERPAPAPAAPAAPGAPTAAPDALAQLRADLDAQAARIAELAARPAFDPAAVGEVQRLAADVAASRQAIDARLAEAGQQAEAIAGQVEETARRVNDTAALAALETALVNGSDGSSAATQLQSAGVQPPEALTRPIPALADLQRDFPEAARAGLREALRSAGTSGGLGNFLRVQTGARSVEPRAGTDPDAILSRAGAAVGNGDIAAALAEIAALPQPARDAMQNWTGPAEAWAAGQQAAGALKANP